MFSQCILNKPNGINEKLCMKICVIFRMRKFPAAAIKYDGVCFQEENRQIVHIRHSCVMQYSVPKFIYKFIIPTGQFHGNTSVLYSKINSPSKPQRK